MKYYAVTNDPAELMHYGVKGMKWGVIRTDAQLGHPRKPRSAAYKRASNKLSKMMKSGIKKAEAHWQEYNSPANKKARANKRELNRMIKAQNRADKQMNKYIEQARKGNLKYGKLTDDQVQRVTERLYLERQARQLGSTEPESFRKRLGAAVTAGVISGVGQGVSTIVGERIGRGSRLKTSRLQNEQQEYFDKRRQRRQEAFDIRKERRQRQNEIDKLEDKERYEASSSTQRRRAKAEANQAYYKMLNEEGIHGGLGQVRLLPGYKTRRAAMTKKYRDANEAAEIAKRNQKTRDDSYYRNLGSNEADRENRSALEYEKNQREIMRPYLQSRDSSYNNLGSGTALARLNADIERTERQQAQMRKYAKDHEKQLSVKRKTAMSTYVAPRESAYQKAMKTWASEVDARERKAQAEAAAASYAARQISKENEERRNRQLTYNQGLSPRITAADINAQRRNMGQSRTRQIRRRSFKG